MVNEKSEYKKRLLDYCKKILEERIEMCQRSIDNAQASANEEDKSSAGDKYETSRAMSHIEKDMYAKQLLANKAEMAALLSVENNNSSEIEKGSLVQCSNYHFFIAAGLGKVEFEKKIIYLISPNAPLALLLFNKKKGDRFIFDKGEISITNVS